MPNFTNVSGTLRSSVAIDEATRGSGSQFQTESPHLPSSIELSTATSSRPPTKKLCIGNVVNNQERGTYSRHSGNSHRCATNTSLRHEQSQGSRCCLTSKRTREQSVKSQHLPIKPSPTKNVPPRALPSKSSAPALPVAKLQQREGKPHDDVDFKQPHSSTTSDLSDLEHIVRLNTSKQSQASQPSKNPEASFEELFKKLAILHISQPACPPETSSGSASYGANTTRTSNRPSQGQSFEQPPESDSDSDTDSERDGEQGGRPPSQDHDGLSERSGQFTLDCPFSKSQRYHNRRECSRCLIAKLPDMQSLKQHIKRTHHYCLKCRLKFTNKRRFRHHIPEGKHCKDCHENFSDPKDLVSHKNRKKCRTRDRGTEKEQWFAIWNRIFPHEPPPRTYRANFVSKLRDCQVTDLMRALPPDSIQNIRAIFEQNQVRSDQLELFDRSMGHVLAMSSQEDDATDVIESTLGDPASSHHDLTPIGSLSDWPSVSPYSTQFLQATSPPSDDLGESTSQNQPSPYSQPYLLHGQPPTFQPQDYSQQTFHGYNQSLPSTMLPYSIPSQDNTALPRWSNGMQSFDQLQSSPTVLNNASPRDHILHRDASTQAGMDQPSGHSFILAPQSSYLAGRTVQASEQEVTPRIYNPNSNVLVTPPRSDNPTYAPGQGIPANNVNSFPTDVTPNAGFITSGYQGYNRQPRQQRPHHHQQQQRPNLNHFYQQR